MKAKNCCTPRYARRYPNEADSGYFQQKLLDGITSVITAMGAITILFYLLVM